MNATLIAKKQYVNPSNTNSSMQERIAIRLQKRLQKQKIVSPPLSKITSAVHQRQKMLLKSFNVDILNSDGTSEYIWNVSLQKYPLFLKPDISISNMQYKLDDDEILNSIEIEVLPQISAPTDITIEDVLLTGAVTRAVTSAVAKEGKDLNTKKLMETVKNNFMEENTADTFISLINRHGKIVNNTNIALNDIQLLATGRSNFKGSTSARVFNVRKALNEHVNNVIVAPGNEFSFNGTLNGPVSERNGWKLAKVIFEGDQLRMAPGGGICQASTTTYRAILNAGLPVIQRRSHSLYVTYYKEYGVGIDATIFPGTQDLTFINDTGNYLLIQAYADGDEAYVNIYGTPDGRKVAMDGPFFSTNFPDDLLINNRNIRNNEIAWKYYVLYSNGKLKTETIVSAYKSLPSYVKQSETAVINSFNILHAAAPLLSNSDNLVAEFIDQN